MRQYSLQELKDYLRDCATETLDCLVPFVVTDPHNLITIDDYVEFPFYAVDLAQTKAGDLIKHIVKIRKQNKPIVILKNIDTISSRKDKDAWQNLIIKALKGERLSLVSDNYELSLPFDKIKAIGTCSVFPDYLRTRGNLGIGPDFSNY